MNELEQSKPSVVTIAKTDMDHFSDIASNFIQALNDKNKNEAEIHQREIQLKEKELEHDENVFKYKFWLLTGILISIVSIAAGIIFFLKDSSLGVNVLSHTFAVIGGILAGVGYESSRNKKNT